MDTRNLERRRQGWYCVRDVPTALVPLVGRKRLRVSLQTRELRIAQRRRYAALAAFEKVLARAGTQNDHADLFAEAMEIRQLRQGTAVAARFQLDPAGAVHEVTA